MSAFGSVTDSLIRLWWERLPLAVGRLSRTLLLVMSEGLYLVAWPTVAAFAPLVTLLAGLLVGWQRFGAETVFTQSVVILFLAVIFGFMGAQLGMMFVAGYAVADFILYGNPAAPFGDLIAQLKFRLALVITYVALAVLAAGIPLAVRLLRAQMPLPTMGSADLVVVVDTAVGGIVGALFVFLYLQGLAVLIRPLYTWQGQVPPTDAVSLVQTWGWAFAFIALIAAILRILMEYGMATLSPEAIGGVAESLEERVRSGFWERLPATAKTIAQAAVGTLVLAGLLDAWSSALILFAGLLIVGWARRSLAVQINVWTRMIGRIPALLRLAIAVGGAYLLSFVLLTGRLYGSSFQPLVWALIISLMLTALLFPETASGSEERRGENRQ
jgi:hypothetical protein